MTFSRLNPLGWTDDIAVITAIQINGIDVNLAKAIDGAAGGAYAPTNPLVIDGSGFGGTQVDTIVTGDMDWRGDNDFEPTSTTAIRGLMSKSGNTGRITSRADYTTITADADADVTVAQDHWLITPTLAADRTFTLRHTGVVAAEGDEIHVLMNQGAGFDYIFQREDTTVVARNDVPSAAEWVTFIYRSASGWVVKAWSGNITNWTFA